MYARFRQSLAREKVGVWRLYHLEGLSTNIDAVPPPCSRLAHVSVSFTSFRIHSAALICSAGPILHLCGPDGRGRRGASRSPSRSAHSPSRPDHLRAKQSTCTPDQSRPQKPRPQQQARYRQLPLTRVICTLFLTTYLEKGHTRSPCTGMCTGLPHHAN